MDLVNAYLSWNNINSRFNISEFSKLGWLVRGKGSTKNCARNWNFSILMVYAYKPEANLENETQNFPGLWETNGSPNPRQKIRPSFD